MCKKMIYLVSFILLLSLALASGAKAADPNLVGWWPLNEGSGDTAPTWPAWRLDRMQGFDSAFSVKPPHASHSIRTTAQIPGDRGFGPAHSGHQNNRAVAKDIGR